MKKNILFIILNIALSLCSFNSQAEHAELIEYGFDCSTGGFAEFELIGNDSEYEYFWSNGATTLSIEGVPKGSYVFTVIDILGCKEEIEVNLYPNVDYLCVAEYTLEYGSDQCEVEISLTFNDEDNTVIWDDGYDGGMVRTVPIGPNTVEYCATITSNINLCCFANVCAIVKGNKSCPHLPPGNENYKNSWDSNLAKVYPSPFIGSFQVDITSKNSGEVILMLLNEAGKVERKMNVTVYAKNPKTITMNGSSISGYKILRVEFPDKETISSNLIELK